MPTNSTSNSREPIGELLKTLDIIKELLKNKPPPDTNIARISNNIFASLSQMTENLTAIRSIGVTSFPAEFGTQLLGIYEEAKVVKTDLDRFSSGSLPSTPAWISKIKDVQKTIILWNNHITSVVDKHKKRVVTFEALEQRWLHIIENVEAQYSSLQRQNEERYIELDKITEELKERSAQEGVVQHAIAFKQQAAAHRRAANWWLVATVVAAILLIAFAYLLFVVPVDAWQKLLFCSPAKDTSAQVAAQLTSHPDSVGQVIRSVFTKAVILSGLYYLLAICTKNYRAHRHNAVVNEHRQNALQSFREFINAAFNEETRTAVLVGTTRLVFTPRATGYGKKDSEAEAPNKLFEAAYTIAKSARSTKSDA